MDGKPCCAPSKPEGKTQGLDLSSIPVSANAGSRHGMVEIQSGEFLMGAEGEETWKADGEGPVREVTIDSFWIDRCCVTNDQFEIFTKETGYQTEAEQFGWSFVFINQIPKAHRKRATPETLRGLEWWVRVDKATWQKPGGPGTNIRKLGTHPVVHVSWNDSLAYAHWAGKRLPSEAEWEKSARGKLVQARYPWGDDLTPKGKHRCNIWQGQFPNNDTAEDGFSSTAPAKSFRTNNFGLYNSAGNVWEWVNDWFDPQWHLDAPLTNPQGPQSGSARVIKGGSFLCHESYCNRYRVGARSSNTPNSSTCHTGFRCAI